MQLACFEIARRQLLLCIYRNIHLHRRCCLNKCRLCGRLRVEQPRTALLSLSRLVQNGLCIVSSCSLPLSILPPSLKRGRTSDARFFFFWVSCIEHRASSLIPDFLEKFRQHRTFSWTDYNLPVCGLFEFAAHYSDIAGDD